MLFWGKIISPVQLFGLPWTTSFKLVHKGIQLVEVKRALLSAFMKVLKIRFGKQQNKERKKKMHIQCLLYVEDQSGWVSIVQCNNFLDKVWVSIILQFLQLHKLFIEKSLQNGQPNLMSNLPLQKNACIELNGNSEQSTWYTNTKIWNESFTRLLLKVPHWTENYR